MPSLPPPNTIIKSLIETALCPCRGRGAGPELECTLRHFIMGADIVNNDYNTAHCPPLEPPSTTTPIGRITTHPLNTSTENHLFLYFVSILTQF